MAQDKATLDADRIWFSHRHKVTDAILNPEKFVGKQLQGDGFREMVEHWQARAAIEAVLQLVEESPAFARIAKDRMANP